MEKNNEESSVSQREEKNKKVRGTMTYHTNGDAEFSAQKEGAPSQEVLKKSKTGKLYRTTSKENPKLCAYLSCDADAPDAAQRLEEQLFPAGLCSTKPRNVPTTRNTGHADMRRRSGAGTDSRQLRCQHQRPRELQATYLQVGR